MPQIPAVIHRARSITLSISSSFAASAATANRHSPGRPNLLHHLIQFLLPPRHHHHRRPHARASSFAVARPIPDAAPVTTATLPLKT